MSSDLAKTKPVAGRACGCKRLREFILERPKAFMWPKRGGGRVLAR
jgi:hypothetical protein